MAWVSVAHQSVCPVQPGGRGAWRPGLQSCNREALTAFSDPEQVSSLSVPEPSFTRPMLPGAGAPSTAGPLHSGHAALSTTRPALPSPIRAPPLGRDHGVCSQASRSAQAQVLPQQPQCREKRIRQRRGGPWGPGLPEALHTVPVGHGQRALQLSAGGGAQRSASSGLRAASEEGPNSRGPGGACEEARPHADALSPVDRRQQASGVASAGLCWLLPGGSELLAEPWMGSVCLQHTRLQRGTSS